MGSSSARHDRWVTRRLARGAAALALVLPGLGALLGAVLASTDAVSAAAATPYQTSRTFTPGTSTFTVPPAVTQVSFDAKGGSGGRGGDTGVNRGGAGGAGAEITGTLDVTPGSVISVYVGSVGNDGPAGNGLGGYGSGGDFPAGRNPGGNGGSTDGSVPGAGGGGGAATELDRGSQLLALAGGGGGGGGGGGIAAYDGGPGGTAATALRGGTGGTGPGAGSGGGTLSCASQNGSHTGGAGTAGSNLAGGGGGGGAGYDGTTCGGAGGHGGGVGAGGGGGGGAGASYVDASVHSAALFPGGSGQGSVTFTWSQPVSSLSLGASRLGTVTQLVATVSLPPGIATPAPTGTVDFSESVFGSESPLGTATVSGGVATLVTSNASSGPNNSIVARYSGDGVYTPSSTFIGFTDPATLATPVVAGSVTPNPFPWNGYGMAMVTVAPPAGTDSWAPARTGTVSLYNTTVSPPALITTKSVTDREVDFIVSSGYDAPSYSFRADYSGDSNYAATSTSFSVPVTPSVAPVITLTTSNAAPVQGQVVEYTVKVRPSSGTVVPTGTVTLFDAFSDPFPMTNATGPVALGSNGTAIFATTAGAPVLHGVYAQYSGDGNVQGAFSSNVEVDVSPASPPVAKAGPAQSVTSGATTTVDGSGSTDPQGEPLAYDWSQLDGPAVVIENHRAARTHVTVAKVTAKTVVHLRLTVTNAAGLSSTSDLTITVSPK